MASVSFGFSKSISKSKVKEEARLKFSAQIQEGHDSVVAVENEEGTRIYPISNEKDLKNRDTSEPIVIPLIKTNEWRFKKGEEREKNEEKFVDEKEEAAKQALLAEAKEFVEENEHFGEAKTIPLIFANKVPEGFETDDKLDPSLRPDEPAEDDYEMVPIECFGMAVLRGMGWKEGDPIGKSNRRVVPAQIPELRPKGLGLGADRSLAANLKGVGKKNGSGKDDANTLKVGAFVKVLRGPQRESYGKIESFDVDNARVMVKLALGGSIATVSQMGIQLVTQKEYERDAKCINKSQYDKYKDKSVYGRDVPEDPLGPIELEEHKTKERKKRKHKRKHSRSPSAESPVKKKLDSVPWVRADLRVRIVDKKSNYYKEKVTTLDAASPDECICKTDSGKIIEGLAQSLLETVIPKSDSAAYVMVVKGKHRGEIGNIVKKDSKQCKAVVQLMRRQDVLITADFNDISHYVGDISAYE